MNATSNNCDKRSRRSSVSRWDSAPRTPAKFQSGVKAYAMRASKLPARDGNEAGKLQALHRQCAKPPPRLLG
jgi:hypothetical protein